MWYRPTRRGRKTLISEQALKNNDDEWYQMQCILITNRLEDTLLGPYLTYYNMGRGGTLYIYGFFNHMLSIPSRMQ